MTKDKEVEKSKTTVTVVWVTFQIRKKHHLNIPFLITEHQCWRLKIIIQNNGVMHMLSNLFFKYFKDTGKNE